MLVVKLAQGALLFHRPANTDIPGCYRSIHTTWSSHPPLRPRLPPHSFKDSLAAVPFTLRHYTEREEALRSKSYPV